MRLNTDNPNTMPVTDAVYGRPPKRKPKPEVTRPRVKVERPISSAIPEEVFRALTK